MHNIEDAVLYALRDAQKEDMILAFGSLSYLRDVRNAYESENQMSKLDIFTKNNLM